jgi:hypothetical protein
VSVQGHRRRLTPQRLILDPVDALLMRRGMLVRPRPQGLLRAVILERLVDQQAPGEGTPIDPPRELVLVRSPSGFLAFFDRVRDETLGVRASGLPAGRYTVQVSGRAYQPQRVAVSLANVPPPYEDLPDDAGAQSAIAVGLEPSFVHPDLIRAGGTQVGGVVTAPTAADLDGVAVALLSAGVVVASYALDRRGQWRLAISDVALPFGGGSPPTANVTVQARRSANLLAEQAATVTQNRSTTIATLALPGA